MSCVKKTSFFERLKLGRNPFIYSQKTPTLSYDPESFWKEQALCFGFDPRKEEISDLGWKSFFFGKYFEYMLRVNSWQLLNFDKKEQSFWKTYGNFITHLELDGTSISLEDFKRFCEWLVNIKSISFSKCDHFFSKFSPDTLPYKILSQLEHVEFKDLKSKIPLHFLSLCSNLKKISFLKCREIAPDIFSHAKSTQLKTVEIRFCPNISDHIFESLPEDLIELDITGSGRMLSPSLLSALPKEILRLKLNRFAHFSDNELEKIPENVQELELEGWSITQNGIDAFRRFKNLKKLKLSSVSYDKFSSGLIKLPKNLESLDLSQNNIQAKDLTFLKELTLLKEFICENCSVCNSNFESFPLEFPSSLETLSLSESGNLHPETIKNIKKTKCTKLRLANCGLSDSDLVNLHPKLKILDISHSEKITDLGLENLKELCSLQSLFLDGCLQIRGFGISFLPNSLSILSLKQCNRFSGRAIQELPTGLKEIYFDFCDLISSEDLKFLPQSIEVLSLSFCKHIDNYAVEILSRFPHLHTVDLHGCYGVDEKGIKDFHRRRFSGKVIIKSGYISAYCSRPCHFISMKDDDIEFHPQFKTLQKLVQNQEYLLSKELI